MDAIKTVHLKYRRSLRTMYVALKKKGVGVSLSTLSCIGKEKKSFRKKKSRLKPMLTKEHRQKRFLFCSLKVDDKTKTYSSNYDEGGGGIFDRKYKIRTWGTHGGMLY